MLYDEAQMYWIWLSSIPGLGAKSFEKLMLEYGEAKYVWEQLILAQKLITPKAYERLRQARTDEYMDKLFSDLEEKEIRAITQLDEEYPYRLRSIPEAPTTLYVKGSCDLNDEKMFAIVGSRKITADGRHFTRTVSRDLAQQGVTIVSGLALGADGQAHEGCLEGGGRTIAVLASSPEFIYPTEHCALAERILEQGGALLSEYPPNIGVDSRFFPRRNRIISGMSDGVLMTEGSVKSGAMITVRYAREHNRPCFAVPGSVYSQASAGPNQMLVDGDYAVISASQVLDHFGWAQSDAAAEEKGEELVELDETERKVVEILRFEEKSFDELAIDMKMTSSELNSLLTILEMQGIIRQSAGKLYRALV